MVYVIYGAGVYGEIFCEEIEKSGIKIDFFVDQYTSKKNLCGKKIKRLKETDIKNVTFFISITSPQIEQIVIKELSRLNAYKIVTFLDVLKKNPDLIHRCVSHTKTWYNSNIKEMIAQEKISKLESLLCDTKSHELLKKIIKFRKNLIYQYYPKPDLDTQYFPTDIELFNHLKNITFVDAGAFIGDTLKESMNEFHKQQKKVECIISFEPDRKNISLLSQEISKQKKLHPQTKFFIYPCGLWSENTFLQFSEDGNSSSSIRNASTQNKNTIMTISLDQTLLGVGVNYIKMDIEGAEKEAIIGAKKIIKDESPILAISLYHKPQDLWELPLLINEINPNYDMFLRIYGSMGLELVLYCVPKNV